MNSKFREKVHITTKIRKKASDPFHRLKIAQIINKFNGIAPFPIEIYSKLNQSPE
jgi:hypothetical protein